MTIIRVLIILLAMVIAPKVFAQACPGSLPGGMDCVAGGGANKDITAHAVCAKITNSHASGKAIMVPKNSTTEWSEFRTKLPSGVTNTACGGGSPPSIVQSATATSGASSTTSLALTFASNCTVNNWVIVGVYGRLSSDTVTAMSGMGATWAKALSGAQAGNNVEIWYGKCLTAGTTVSITNSNTNLRVNVGVELANLTGTLDAVSTPNYGSSFSVGAVSLATSQANSFTFTAAVVDKQATFSNTYGALTHLHAGTIDAGSGGSRVTGTAIYVIDAAGSNDVMGGVTWTGTGSPTSTAIAATFR